MTEEFINFISPYIVSIFGSYAVPVISVIGVVIMLQQVIKQIKGLCESVKHNDGYEKIEQQLNLLVQENNQLKDKCNELLTELSKVKHDD